MRISIDNLKVSVWLLLLYTYLIWLRSIVLPPESFVTPALMMLVLTLTVIGTRGKLSLGIGTLKIQAISWLLILVYISIDNRNFLVNLINHGMIQYFVLISFMLFCIEKKDWTVTWIHWTKVYAIIHSVATIYFYIFRGLYPIFANLAFSGQELYDTLKQFNSGWMPGICKNVSANGMVLSICFLVYVESFIHTEKKETRDWIWALIIGFALLLTGKRGPLLFIIISMSVSYLVQQKDRSGVIRFIKFVGIGLIFVLLTVVTSHYVPAINNIFLKSEELSQKSNGILNGRLSLWSYGLEIFKQSPIIGKGYWSYAVYAEAIGAITTSAHNFYLQVIAELGILGLTMYIIAFTSGIKLCIQGLRRSNDEKDRTLFSIALCIQLFTILYGLSASSFIYNYIMVPYFISCGAVRSLYYRLESVSSGVLEQQ